MTLSFKSVLSRRSQRKGHARGPWCRLSLPMNQLCARVCETETDLQVQEEEAHSAAVLAGFIPVSPWDLSWKSFSPSLEKAPALCLDPGFLRRHCALWSLESGLGIFGKHSLKRRSKVTTSFRRPWGRCREYKYSPE